MNIIEDFVGGPADSFDPSDVSSDLTVWSAADGSTTTIPVEGRYMFGATSNGGTGVMWQRYSDSTEWFMAAHQPEPGDIYISTVDPGVVQYQAGLAVIVTENGQTVPLNFGFTLSVANG